MGKGIGHVYKQSKRNWKCPSPNTVFVAPPRSAFLPQRDIADGCSISITAPNQPSHVSILTTTNHVDTDVNNDDGTQSFETSRKHHHRTPEIRDTNTITTPSRCR